MLILGQHIRMDQALDWRQEDRVLFSSLPSIFGTTFREHSPLPAFFSSSSLSCAYCGAPSPRLLPLGHGQESFGYTLIYPLFPCT